MSMMPFLTRSLTLTLVLVALLANTRLYAQCMLIHLLFPCGDARADRPIRGGELRSRRQDLHPVKSLPLHRHRKRRSPLRLQQWGGGRQGVAPDCLGDEETADERRLRSLPRDLIRFL
jgi:hypothetical protein